MKIFIGNLSRDVSDEVLTTAFEAFGKVESATVLKEKFTGESRGFGFVEMSSNEEAQAAISGLNGTDLKGKTLTVNEARPREESGGPRRRPGGGGGGGGNRGGDKRRTGGGGGSGGGGGRRY